MSQIVTKGLAANAATGPKINIGNNISLRGRNAANSADVNIIKVNASDFAELGVGLNAAALRMFNMYLEPVQLASDPAGVTGQVYYNTTSNTLKFYNGTVWSAIGGGSGANTALSNLIATAINQDLKPGVDVGQNLGSASFRWGVVFADQANDASNLKAIDFTNRQLYDASGASASLDWSNGTGLVLMKDFVTQGQMNVYSSLATTAGISISTNDPSFTPLTSGNISGDLSLFTGGTAAGASSGSASLTTGPTVNATSGSLTVGTGAPSGTGTSGPVDLYSGNVATATGGSGTVSIYSGNVLNGVSGNLNSWTGNATGTGDSGSRDYATGTAVNAGNSGSMNFYTGTVVDGGSGTAIFQTGGASGTGSSGQIQITAGTAAAGADSEGTIELSAYRTNLAKGVLRFFNNAADPTDLAAYLAGDTYYNDTSNQIKYYNGTSWVALSAGSGANVTLSNLTNPTAINQNLTFDIAGIAYVQTKDQAATTYGMYMKSGDSSGASSGDVAMYSGTSVGAVTGGVQIFSGQPPSNFNSGLVDVSTGAGTGTGSSGGVDLHSGDAVDGGSGAASLRSGVVSGTGSSGAIGVFTGNVTGSGGNSGDLSVYTGTVAGSGNATGNLSLSTGNPAGGGTSYSGNVFINTGASTVNGVSGTVTIQSGDTVDGISGDVSLRSGPAAGTAGTGALTIASGNTQDGGSGGVSLATGSAAVTGGGTGNFSIDTGAVAAGAGGSGSVAMQSGPAVDGASGSITIQTGGSSGTGTTGGLILGTGAAAAGADNVGEIVINAYRMDFAQGVLQFFNSAADPTDLTTYAAGDTYYNTTSNELRVHDGTSWVAPAAKTWGKVLYTLLSGDITNQYYDLTEVAVNNSVDVFVKGQPMGIEDSAEDYTLAYTGGVSSKTRINFATNWATGGGAALVAGDVLVIKFQY